MKIKYNVADIKPEIIDLMKEYVSEEAQTEVVSDLYWMLVFAHRSEKAHYGMKFFYMDRAEEDSYYAGTTTLELWDKIYKASRKDCKHAKERGYATH